MSSMMFRLCTELAQLKEKGINSREVEVSPDKVDALMEACKLNNATCEMRGRVTVHVSHHGGGWDEEKERVFIKFN